MKYIYLSLDDVLHPQLLGEEKSWGLPWKIPRAADLTLMSSVGMAA